MIIAPPLEKHMEISNKLADRLVYACGVATGKRTLDIGGRGMPPTPDNVKLFGPDSFSLKKEDPGQSASEYRVLDAR